MATMDDKLMGEKLHYYCSSSEDEDDSGGGLKVSEDGPEATGQPAPGTINTGPKGVVQDWQRYKQLESEQRDEAAREKLELAKKLSMTCRTTEEDEASKKKDAEMDAEMEALLADDEAFFNNYLAQRMQEMEMKINSKKRFGAVIELRDGEEFLKALEAEDKSVVVCVYVFEPEIDGCTAMAKCIKSIAKEYPLVKFTQIQASAVGFSKHFKTRGVPAILVYKAGELVTSFPRLTDTLGDDFHTLKDLINLLLFSV